MPRKMKLAGTRRKSEEINLTNRESTNTLPAYDLYTGKLAVGNSWESSHEINCHSLTFTCMCMHVHANCKLLCLCNCMGENAR